MLGLQRSGLCGGAVCPRRAGAPRAAGNVPVDRPSRATRCSSNGSAETSGSASTSSHPVMPALPVQQLAAAALLMQMRDWTQRIGQWMRQHRLQQLLFG